MADDDFHAGTKLYALPPASPVLGNYFPSKLM